MTTTRDARLRQLIREYRVVRGLSQGEVARRVGINRATYQRLEGGITPLNRVDAICAAIGCDPAALMREAGFDAVKEEK